MSAMGETPFFDPRNPPPLTVRGTPRRTRHYGTRSKIQNPEFVRKTLLMSFDGKSARMIAKALGTNTNTVEYILAAFDMTSLRKEAAKRVGAALPEIASMVTETTIALKDRRLGHEILDRAGVYDEARPAAQADPNAGRVVIEWSGAPPPWAPPPVIEAHKATLAEKVRATEREANVIAIAPPSTNNGDGGGNGDANKVDPGDGDA
jgi:hypothetical protein